MLTLTNDCPWNTRLVGPDGTTQYGVTTSSASKNNITTVRNDRNENIATLEWRSLLSDKVVLGESKPISVHRWLKKSIIPFKSYVKCSHSSIGTSVCDSKTLRPQCREIQR